jgi:hypothetical protein
MLQELAAGAGTDLGGRRVEKTSRAPRCARGEGLSDHQTSRASAHLASTCALPLRSVMVAGVTMYPSGSAMNYGATHLARHRIWAGNGPSSSKRARQTSSPHHHGEAPEDGQVRRGSRWAPSRDFRRPPPSGFPLRLPRPARQEREPVRRRGARWAPSGDFRRPPRSGSLIRLPRTARRERVPIRRRGSRRGPSRNFRWPPPECPPRLLNA